MTWLLVAILSLGLCLSAKSFALCHHVRGPKQPWQFAVGALSFAAFAFSAAVSFAVFLWEVS